MDPGIIRWIDKNIGRPFCFFLTLCRKLSDIFKRRSPRYKRPARILFIKLIEQGSTVLAYPAMKRAKELFGEKNLFFLVFKENRPILDILNIIPRNNIFEIDPGNGISFIYSSIKALAKIRENRIDGAVDMEFFTRGSAVLSYLSGADKRAGLHPFDCEGPYRGNLFTHRLAYNPYLSTKLFFLSLVESLIHPPNTDETPMTFKVPEAEGHLPVISPSEEEKSSLIQKIENIKGSALSGPVIILNANIGDLLPIRKWPSENFVKLGNMLLKEYPDATLILSGSSKEKKETEKIASGIKKSVSMAGRTSLRELITLYHVADILITNDSGPGQFSALTPVKSVILFGPETPVLYGEPGAGRKIIASDLICSPCVNVYNHRQSSCKTGECLKSVTVENVFSAVREKLI